MENLNPHSFTLPQSNNPVATGLPLCSGAVFFMETKICRKCGEEKPLTDYWHNHKMSDGRLNICIDCTKIYKTGHPNKYKYNYTNKEWYAGHRDKKTQHNNNYKVRFPEKIVSQMAARYEPNIEGLTKHHWNYDKEHGRDIIYLSVARHRLLHRVMTYDKSLLVFRKPDGTLLDTKEKHIEYIESITLIKKE